MSEYIRIKNVNEIKEHYLNEIKKVYFKNLILIQTKKISMEKMILNTLLSNIKEYIK